jgi:antitoxin ParD1/3/4
MATMNVSLPDQMKEWVEAQAENGRYSNASDYVRDLIRRDQVKTEKIAAMQIKIDEGLASGVSTLTPEELFEKIRNRTLRPREIAA